jgi:hypothetical protein
MPVVPAGAAAGAWAKLAAEVSKAAATAAEINNAFILFSME